ncbi:MAG: PxKF domain-containing protein [Myxococcales bacterium]
MTSGLLLSAAGCSGEDEADLEVAGLEQGLGQANASIVISQVYGGGGNSGATFRNDFVELFNRSQSAVTLTDWSVQYASSTGTGNFSANGITVINATLQPGQYYLVQLAGGANGAALPAADATGTTNLSGTGGKVILANTRVGLACNGANNPCGALESNIVDLVGWDGANYFEGSAAPATTNPSAVQRNGGGCVDTNNNGADFTLVNPPVPHNSASTPATCSSNTRPGVASTLPSNGASGVAQGAALTVNFSEPVSVSGSWFAIQCSQSGSVTATASGTLDSYTLTPAAAFATGESCTVTIFAASVQDQDAGANMQSDYQFFFSIALPLTAIREIQGSTHLSPLNGQNVRTSGIVTARGSNGYWLQDPSPDQDDATSEGIFVFTSSSPSVQVGDGVEVSGRVSEFRPGCSGTCDASSSGYSNLTITELTSPTTHVISSGNPLPAPVVIGAGGRVPPSVVIENDVSGNVESAANTFDPAQDGIDFYETLEGMRVQLNDAVVVGPTHTFSAASKETYVVGDNGANAGLRTARGGVVITDADKNPERLVLDNGVVSAMPDANVGDSFPGAIVGVLDYDFANYHLMYSQALPALSTGGLARETLSLPVATATDLNIAAFNVENLDPNDPASKFAELASILVNSLQSPDIVALEEIQDNNGATNNGVVDASVTFTRLIQAVADAGGPAYQYRSINPVDGQDGGEPGGNIRVGFLFRTDRGVSFVDRGGADSLTANAVVSEAGAPKLVYSPGRIDPTNSAFANSRKPLAAEFVFQGATLFVIANHFNSKGGDQPLFGRFQPPALSSEVQRLAQANVVADFVEQILALDADANVVVLGDLNDFEFSAPVNVLKSAGLTTLVETLPAQERYTYVYEGNSQVLDHVLVSNHALSRTAGFDVVHVNAEFASQASDHDPGVARLRPNAMAPVLMGPGNLSVEATGPAGAPVAFVVTANDDVEGDVPVSCTPASGSVFGFGTTSVNCSAADTAGNVGHTSFTVSVHDTTAPLLLNVPDPITAFATKGNGAVVSYGPPSASDLVDGNVPVPCAPASGSRFAPGTTLVSCSALDAAGNSSSAQFPVVVTFSTAPGSSLFEQPINADGTSVFKLGRTVPVKFRLTGPSAGVSDLVARLFVAKVSDGVEGTFVEADSTSAADDGNTFRYDCGAKQYIFNLSTKALTKGTWALSAVLGDGVLHSVHVSFVK